MELYQYGNGGRRAEAIEISPAEVYKLRDILPAASAATVTWHRILWEAFIHVVRRLWAREEGGLGRRIPPPQATTLTGAGLPGAAPGGAGCILHDDARF